MEDNDGNQRLYAGWKGKERREKEESKMVLVSRERLVSSFVAGLGIQLGVNALFGAVGFAKLHFGASSFVWINVAVFSPVLAVSLALRSVKFGLELHTFRLSSPWSVMASFLASALILLLLPTLFSTSLNLVLQAAFVLGLLSAFQYSALFAIALQVHSKGWFEMTLSFGFQASCLIVLIAKWITGFSPDASPDATLGFFGLCALMMTFTTVGVYWFCSSFVPNDVLSTTSARDVENYPDEMELLSQERHRGGERSTSLEEQQGLQSEDETESLSGRVVMRHVWPCALAVFLTSFSSMVVFPFYSFVASTDPDANSQANFAVSLFYTKVISDTFSRPVTMAVHLFHDQRALLHSSIVRFLFGVPFFFLYTFWPSLLPRSDFGFAVFIAIFSATSGLFITYGYQLASEVTKTSGLHASQVSFIVNCSFQAGLFFALILAVIVIAHTNSVN